MSEGGLVKARDQCSPGATPISLGRDLIFDILYKTCSKGNRNSLGTVVADHTWGPKDTNSNRSIVALDLSYFHFLHPLLVSSRTSMSPSYTGGGGRHPHKRLDGAVLTLEKGGLVQWR